MSLFTIIYTCVKVLESEFTSIILSFRPQSPHPKLLDVKFVRGIHQETKHNNNTDNKINVQIYTLGDSILHPLGCTVSFATDPSPILLIKELKVRLLKLKLDSPVIFR